MEGSVQTHAIGDWLLTLPASEKPPGPRLASQKWQPDYAIGGAAVYTTGVSSAWKGFPCQKFNAPFGTGWLLGEYDHPLQTSLKDCLRRADLAVFDVWVCALNGRFLAVLHAEKTNTWHVWTDPFGTLHIYHAHLGSRAALGTFSPAVAAAAGAGHLDWEGLAAFFNFGFFMGDRTHFQDLKILRPACHHEFDGSGGKIRESRYWNWQHEPDPHRSYQETLDAYDEIFTNVLEEHFRDGRIALPISGGLDSRSTLVPIRKDASRFWSYSYGYGADSIEVEIAQRLAERRSIPFRGFAIRPYVFERLEEITALTEGFQDITQARQAFVRDEIAAHADTLIGALWGDVWHDATGYHPVEGVGERDGVLRQTFGKLQKDTGGWLWKRLVGPQLGHTGTAPAFLAGQVLPELDSLAHLQDPDFRIKAFKTWQWSFRWSLVPVRIFQSAAWPRLVFYDRRLVDFFQTVPTDFVRGRRLQIDHLKTRARDLARVDWQPYGADLFHYHQFDNLHLPKRAFRKIRRLLHWERLLERNWEVQFLDDSGRVGLSHWLLRKGLNLHEFVRPEDMRELVEKFYRDPWQDKHTPHTLSMLLSFSGWLEMYGR